ncbi:hypothetical protein DPMN_156822 [Dreissena polymorpha]|uniref:Uncharacterized protein n=1 Tax=Dreissena polymorpha TaxID=45954 RepID=A0A9D4J944_DREPO|nr:hypothetical protein DPMN_156822 [Dreissena polymorpha]
MHAEAVGAYDANFERTIQSRESEIGRSLNSEEVARGLGTYAEDDAMEPQKCAAKAPLKSPEDDDAVLVFAFNRPGIPDVGASGEDYRRDEPIVMILMMKLPEGLRPSCLRLIIWVLGKRQPMVQDLNMFPEQ